MIVEQRTYTLFMGATPTYLELYEREGWPLQKQYLAKLLGYYTSEIGPLNQVVHLWAYESFEDRLLRRAKMGADKAWRAYVDKIRPLIQSQESKLLRPTNFSPAVDLNVS